MLCEPTPLSGVIVVTPKVFRDPRGCFMETYHAAKYREAGIPAVFVQDNLSRSIRGTLRGLHAQRRRPQGKLIRVVEGEIFDVAVDIRRGSSTFLGWVGVHLSGENARQCYVPPGFAHGFCVLSDHAVVEYKCTDFYDPADELGILWSEPSIGVAWPVDDPILSPKDGGAQRLREVLDLLPTVAGPSDEVRPA
jgi:dTDP-4-dehydrorhamnose 3,5-epimerase